MQIDPGMRKRSLLSLNRVFNRAYFPTSEHLFSILTMT